MLDMVVKVRENLAMLPSKQPKFKEGRRPNYTYNNKKVSKLKFKEVSEEELAEVICKIRQDAKKERKNRVIILILSILTLIVILFVLEHFFRWVWQ